MPRVIVDTTNVPEDQRGFQTYDGPTPGKGLYKALWKRGWWTKTKDGQKTMLKVLFILETDHKEKKVFNGYPVFHNVTYEASTQWKMQELFDALRAGRKAAVDYDEQGAVTRIGRAVPGKTYLLIDGKEDWYQGKQRLVPNTLAPLPLPEGEEDTADEEWVEEGEATAFEEAGGIAQGEYASEDPWVAHGEPSEGEPPF